MQKSNLQKSIFVGFAVIWLIISVVILHSVYRINNVTSRLDKIANEHNIKIALAVKLRDILYQRQLLMRNALMLGDVFDREEMRQKLALLAQQFVRTRMRLEAMPLNADEQLLNQRLRDELQKPNQEGRALIDEMVFLGMTQRTLKLLRTVSIGQTRIINVLNELVGYETNLIDQAVATTRAQQVQSRNILVLFGGLVAVLIFVVAYLVARNSRKQTDQIELLARFPSENPRPVMRFGFNGELIYANTASESILKHWHTEVGSMVPQFWRQIVSQMAIDRDIVEEEVAIGAKIYSMVLTPVAEGNYVNVYAHDVTEREEIRREYARLASHDSLTGLINRRELELNLDKLITDAKTTLGEHSFLYFDLDQFKVVNDTCGHVAGDEMLRQLSAVLKENVRESDKLGRLGGDEFGLLLRSCTLQRAEKVAETLRQLVENFRFVWKNKTFNVGASIGVVQISAHSGNLSSVLSAADTACYVAKEAGRNRIHVSYPGDEQVQVRRGQMEWVQRIREALDKNQFELYFQEIFTLDQKSPGPAHGELLLRLFDEDGTRLPIETIISSAERFDLMSSIDRWVVENGLAALSNYLQADIRRGGWFSINLSGQSVSDSNFTSFVIDQIEKTGIPPASICFEITETAAISNLTRAIEFINIMRAKGCRIALDDFGSGLSSFSYLKNLKIDYLKIDGSFVRDMHEDRVNAAMVEAITNVAREMKIGVIAEWVENQATVKLLQKLKVEYAQGYAFSEPLPIHRLDVSKVAN